MPSFTDIIIILLSAIIILGPVSYYTYKHFVRQKDTTGVVEEAVKYDTGIVTRRNVEKSDSWFSGFAPDSSKIPPAIQSHLRILRHTNQFDHKFIKSLTPICNYIMEQKLIKKFREDPEALKNLVALYKSNRKVHEVQSTISPEFISNFVGDLVV